MPRTTLPTWKKLLFAAVAITMFFMALEGLLVVAGFSPAAVDKDPLVGFSATLPLFVPDDASSDGELVTAANKRGLFNEQRFVQPKPAGTYRIFCLGGSTCYGHPYDDRTSFAGWLRELLPCADDGRRWEVINAGGVSYASYREAALVEELCQYQPDLFIVFTGHNEFLEERTYGGLQQLPAALKDASGLLARTRTYTALRSILAPWPPEQKRFILPAEVDAVLDHTVGPSAYHRDETLKRQIVEHFEFNLRRLARLARAAGAQILYLTPVSNLKDCSPFKSEHREGFSAEHSKQWTGAFARARKLQAAGDLRAALAACNECLALDDRYAEAHYRRGQCLLGLGLANEARESFLRAREEDICPLRAIEPVVAAVRQAAAREQAPCIDFERILDEHCHESLGHELPGSEFFLDHVHPTIEVNGLVAGAIVDELVRQGVVRAADDWDQRCMSSVGEQIARRLTPQDRAVGHRMVAKVFSWAGKLEEAGLSALAALAILPEDRESLFIAGAYEKSLGHDQAGNEYYRRALEIEVGENPQDVEARQLLAKTLVELGEPHEAIRYLNEALRLRPEDKETARLMKAVQDNAM